LKDAIHPDPPLKRRECPFTKVGEEKGGLSNGRVHEVADLATLHANRLWRLRQPRRRYRKSPFHII